MISSTDIAAELGYNDAKAGIPFDTIYGSHTMQDAYRAGYDKFLKEQQDARYLEELKIIDEIEAKEHNNERQDDEPWEP